MNHAGFTMDKIGGEPLNMEYGKFPPPSFPVIKFVGPMVMLFSAIWKSRVSRSSRMNIYIYNIYNENCLNGHFRNLNWSYLSYSLIWYFRFMKFPLVGPLSFSWFWRVWLGSETQHQTRRIISSFTSRVMVRRRESPEKKTRDLGKSTAFLSLFYLFLRY